MRSLPYEILAEILCRLPIKSLLRLQGVSKQWHSLISDPKSVVLPQREKVLVLTPDRLQSLDCSTKSLTDLYDFPFQRRQTDGSSFIVGSSNGLICVTVEEEKGFFIWNPSTRVYKKLPDPEIPYRSAYCYGFGYDSSTDDYKVLVVTSRGNPRLVKLFSMKAFSWKNIQYNLGDEIHRRSPRKGCLVNGALHWLISGYDLGIRVIIAFDLAEEKFGRVGKPCNRRSSSLGVLGGCLSLNTHSFSCYWQVTGFNDNDFGIWVMKQYGVHSSWERLTKIEASNDLHYYGRLETLCTTTSGDQIIMTSTRKDLIICNPKENTLHTLYRLKCRLCETVACTETRISPKLL